MAWLWAAIIFLVFFGVPFYWGFMRLGEHAVATCLRVLQMVMLPLWYFAAARAQGKFVVKQLRGEYFRESWFVPVIVAIVPIYFPAFLAAFLRGASGSL